MGANAHHRNSFEVLEPRRLMAFNGGLDAIAAPNSRELSIDLMPDLRQPQTVQGVPLGAFSGGGLAAAIEGAHALSAAAARAVFSSTNAAAGNEVVMYRRGGDGMLSLVGEFATGGDGTGASLGNQGAVVRSDNGRWLLAVNAGSNDISVFRVTRDGLVMTDLEPSGGSMPVSVTIHRNLVYVLNGGGSGNITGFRLNQRGQLAPISGSTRPLSGAVAPAPAQVEFSPDGSLLVVTEKSTNLIDTYQVSRRGLASGPLVQPSSGMTPFGFGFAGRRSLIVSEAFGGAVDASAVSAYSVDPVGDLDVDTPSSPTTETAACWIVVTNDRRFTYTTNTGSGTITGYAINRRTGVLTRLDQDGVTAVTGAGSAPTDMALSRNGRFLYALNSATGEIDVFAVNRRSGALSPVQSVGGLPPNATGLTAT